MNVTGSVGYSRKPAKSLYGSGNRIIPARRIGNIQPNEERIATSSPDFGYAALGHLFIEVADYDLGAFFRETLRLSGAEPAPSPRAERNLASEAVSHSSSSKTAQRRQLTTSDKRCEGEER